MALIVLSLLCFSACSDSGDKTSSEAKTGVEQTASSSSSTSDSPRKTAENEGASSVELIGGEISIVPNPPGREPLPKGEPFHIGLVTGTDHQGTDVLMAANEVIEQYGSAESGGLIEHITYPDSFLADLETTISRIEALADDPLMKAVVVYEGVPGTAEAFSRIRQKRPDIYLLVCESHEDAAVIAPVADLVVNADFISRGYLIPYAAKQLGAKTFVHVSFPRHMIDESLSRQRYIMEMAAKDLGLTFVYENAPDPTGEAGLEGAKNFILEKIPVWLEKYGADTAFYTTNNAHTAPMIRQVVKYGGYFVEADEPSPLMGYPEALELDVEGANGDWKTVVEKIENVIVDSGAGGRLGTWTSSIIAGHVKAMVEFGRELVLGETATSDTVKLLSLYDKLSPGSKWNGNFFVDASLKVVPNVFLIYQDTYILGRGYLGTSRVTIPPKYLSAGLDLKKPSGPPPFHIAIVTGDLTHGAEDVIGAQEMIRRYGSVEDGGLIRHVVYPNELVDDEKGAAALIESVADDPLLKVIVVNQAIEGTAEAFARIKAKRPEVICLSGEPHESPETITQSADLVVSGDYISRGYLLPLAARELGAKTFVHISFERHLAHESIRHRLKIMREACADLGLAFAEETAPDPVGEEDLEGARLFIMEQTPKWLEKYGQDTAFFATNDFHTEPLLVQLAKYGGYFVEADIPSPLTGYPAAFDIDLEPYLGQWNVILDLVDKKVVEAGAKGRLGTWAYPLGFTQSAGLVEFGKLLAEGQTTVSDIQTLLKCLGMFSPGARWNGSFLNDSVSGKPLRNYLLVYQDTYIFGLGYMETTKVEIPDKYFAITPN
ncbi:MAG: DUF3798 domain-containing protein [Deltaproteobacteria bacterium]|nr:DUF3798 domain-containing protein [Deltaproteobacteria bacterium]